MLARTQMNRRSASPRCKHCRERIDSARPAQVIHEGCAEAWTLALIAKRNAKAAKADRVETRARKEKIKTIPQLIKAAQVEFNNFVRLRDAGKPCICCGRIADDKDLLTGSRWDAGHYRSTGSASHLRFHEDNCHRQLVRCNRHGAGRAVDYRIGLVRRIGLAAVEALESSNEPHKWTRQELIEIRDTYRAKVRELKKASQT
jgi:hypothetical protein